MGHVADDEGKPAVLHENGVGESVKPEVIHASPEPGTSSYRIKLRIDVPGESSDPGKYGYDHRAGFEDFGHMSISLESPLRTDTIGFYPERRPGPFDNPRTGIPGEIRDDSKHAYEYEASFELTRDEHSAVQRYVAQVRAVDPMWRADYWCTNFALEAAWQGGVEVKAEPKARFVDPIAMKEVTAIYPGDVANTMLESGVGAPVESGNEEDGKWSGK